MMRDGRIRLPVNMHQSIVIHSICIIPTSDSLISPLSRTPFCLKWCTLIYMGSIVLSNFLIRKLFAEQCSSSELQGKNWSTIKQYEFVFAYLNWSQAIYSTSSFFRTLCDCSKIALDDHFLML